MNPYQRPLEVIEKEGDPNRFRGFTGCKNMNQVFAVGLRRFSKNEEARQITRMYQAQFKRFHSEKIEEMITKIELIGWKGKDNISINTTFSGDFLVREHRKDKGTGVVKATDHTIKCEDVNTVLYLLKDLNIGEKVTYKVLVSRLIDFKKLPVRLTEFNGSGGKNRNTYYFPLYHFPLKILEDLKIINYGGGGKITRLK